MGDATCTTYCRARCYSGVGRETIWRPQFLVDAVTLWPWLLWKVHVSYRPRAKPSTSPLCGLPGGYVEAPVGGVPSLGTTEPLPHRDNRRG